MGIKIEGPVCASCKTLIEGNDFIVCNQCHATIHRTDYCRKIHMNTCNFGKSHDSINPEVGRTPDVRDIFKY